MVVGADHFEHIPEKLQSGDDHICIKRKNHICKVVWNHCVYEMLIRLKAIRE